MNTITKSVFTVEDSNLNVKGKKIQDAIKAVMDKYKVASSWIALPKNPSLADWQKELGDALIYKSKTEAPPNGAMRINTDMGTLRDKYGRQNSVFDTLVKMLSSAIDAGYQTNLTFLQF